MLEDPDAMDGPSHPFFRAPVFRAIDSFTVNKESRQRSCFLAQQHIIKNNMVATGETKTLPKKTNPPPE